MTPTSLVPLPPSAGLARGVSAACGAAARRPKLTVGLWIALVIICVLAGSFTGTRTLSAAGSLVGPSARAQQQLTRAGLEDPDREQILIRSASATRTTQAVDILRREAQALRGIAGVVGPGTSHGLTRDHGRIALVTVSLGGDPDDADTQVMPLTGLIRRLADSTPGVSFQQAGPASEDDAISQVVSHGLRRAEFISIPITLLILLLAFGSVVAASVPLILGVTSVAAAMGAMGAVSHLIPDGSSTAPVVVLIGLAVGIDYSLFYIRRERAERRAGARPEVALEATAATVGRAIVVAGLTVIIGLTGLLVSGFGVFTSMAAGAIIVVAIAVLGSLTVLPAVLTLLGDRVERGRLWRWRGPRNAGIWSAVAAAVTARPRRALLLSLIPLLALCIPVLHLHTGADDARALPRQTPVLRAAAAINADFPGTSDTADLVVTGHGLATQFSQARLRQLGLDARARVHGDGPVVVRVARRGSVARVTVPVPDGSSHRLDADVGLLRRQVVPEVARWLPGAQVLVSGADAENVDFTARLAWVTPLVLAATLLLAFGLLVRTFGSAQLALGVMALNLLSVGAAFGLLVIVFQHTWAQSLLGFTSTGVIVDWLPLFAFVVLFGLSMDYTVLVLERAVEARRDGSSACSAAATAITTTGATVSSAALVMVSVFAIFATLPMLDFKQMGVGLAAAILLDATVVRSIALPALLSLLGDRGVPASPRDRRRARPRDVAGWDHRERASAPEVQHV